MGKRPDTRYCSLIVLVVVLKREASHISITVGIEDHRNIAVSRCKRIRSDGHKFFINKTIFQGKESLIRGFKSDNSIIK
ncbi:hypothetical protein D3C86_1981230 [compost metagenome]